MQIDILTACCYLSRTWSLGFKHFFFCSSLLMLIFFGQDYADRHPDCVLLDPLASTRRLLDRYKQYQQVCTCDLVCRGNFFFFTFLYTFMHACTCQGLQRLYEYHFKTTGEFDPSPISAVAFLTNMKIYALLPTCTSAHVGFLVSSHCYQLVSNTSQEFAVKCVNVCCSTITVVLVVQVC